MEPGKGEFRQGAFGDHAAPDCIQGIVSGISQSLRLQTPTWSYCIWGLVVQKPSQKVFGALIIGNIFGADDLGLGGQSKTMDF